MLLARDPALCLDLMQCLMLLILSIGCGDVGIRSFILSDTDLRNGGDPDADFNTSSMPFLAKGEDDHDAIAVLKDPLLTRP